MCYACLNYCPQSAIQIKSKIYMKSYTVANGRYPHPFATVADIAGQKRWVSPDARKSGPGGGEGTPE